MEASIIIFTLNKNEFKYVRSFFIGWKLIMNGILSPKTIFPLTSLPCKYRTRREKIATAKNPALGFYCKLTKAGSRKGKTGFWSELIVVPIIWINQIMVMIKDNIPKNKYKQYTIGLICLFLILSSILISYYLAFLFLLLIGLIPPISISNT